MDNTTHKEEYQGKEERIHKRKKRTDRWKELKRQTTLLIKQSKSEYYRKYTGDSRLYYKVVGRLKRRESPRNFCVSELFPEQSDNAAAESVADFFSSIGDKFEPLPFAATPTKISFKYRPRR